MSFCKNSSQYIQMLIIPNNKKIFVRDSKEKSTTVLRKPMFSLRKASFLENPSFLSLCENNLPYKAVTFVENY